MREACAPVSVEDVLDEERHVLGKLTRIQRESLARLTTAQRTAIAELTDEQLRALGSLSDDERTLLGGPADEAAIGAIGALTENERVSLRGIAASDLGEIARLDKQKLEAIAGLTDDTRGAMGTLTVAQRASLGKLSRHRLRNLGKPNTTREHPLDTLSDQQIRAAERLTPDQRSLIGTLTEDQMRAAGDLTQAQLRALLKLADCPDAVAKLTRAQLNAIGKLTKLADRRQRERGKATPEEEAHLRLIPAERRQALGTLDEEQWSAIGKLTSRRALETPPDPSVAAERADDLAALCLSGGGIRSAAFCLGALQALATGDVLHDFNYLSTVSGGGYIGGWLTRCIGQKRLATPGLGTDRSVLKKALDEILRAGSPQIAALRRYVNFLTPNPGVASNDTWAAVALYLRNTIINWLVFIPLLVALASVPAIYQALVSAFVAQAYGPWRPLAVAADGAGVLGLLALGWSVLQSALNAPSHAFGATPRPPSEGRDDHQLLLWIVIPSMVWAFLAPLAVVAWIARPWSDSASAFRSAVPVPVVLSFAVMLIAYGLARVRIRAHEDLPSRDLAHDFISWILSISVSAAILAGGIRLAVGLELFWVALAGPAWVTLADTLRITIYVALRREGVRSDLDREWFARLNASKLRIVIAFLLLAVAARYLPVLVFDQFGGVRGFIAAAMGLLSGSVAAAIGRSALTSFTGASPTASKDASVSARIGLAAAPLAIPLAVGLFAATLVMLASRALDRATGDGGSRGFLAHAGELAIIAAVMLLALFFLDRFVNLNRFSMHAVYRNRLVRAFLGTARRDDERCFDRFTSFDPADNSRVYDNISRDRNYSHFDTSPEKDGPAHQLSLLPVINVTLNRTVGMDTARSARKAEPFTITPLHCGSASLTAPDMSGRRPGGAYIPTQYYASGSKETGPGDKRNGITLGTAMTISGAAVSPDMGYNSSPALAFVMTLFNVRLGAWLPNPAMRKLTETQVRRAGPPHGLTTMLHDLAGRASASGDFVYLSDGGHFDNLGLYEMLRRKCRHILVVDAGRDELYKYQDLGRALQMSLLDFGVTADFIQPIEVGATELRQYGAYARLLYDGGEAGQLIYLKPWLPLTAPMELQAFKALKEEFPHESTLDQFFTESDFESYRRLGAYLTERLLGGRPGDLETLFHAVKVKAEAAQAKAPQGGCAAAVADVAPRLRRVLGRRVLT